MFQPTRRVRLSTLILTGLFASTLSVNALAAFKPANGVCGVDCKLTDDRTGLTWSRALGPVSRDEAAMLCQNAGARLPTYAEMRAALANGLDGAVAQYPIFGPARGRYWTSESQCGSILTPGMVPAVCINDKAQYRCVERDYGPIVASTTSCNENNRVMRVRRDSDGRTVPVWESVSRQSITRQISELAGRARLMGLEDDVAVARVLLAVTPKINAFSDLGEAMIGSAQNNQYFARRVVLRRHFDEVMRGLARADAFLAQQGSDIFSASEFENIRCEASQVLTTVLDPRGHQRHYNSCPLHTQAFARYFCQSTSGQARYGARFGDDNWIFVNQRQNAEGYTHLLQNAQTGQQQWFKLDELLRVQ